MIEIKDLQGPCLPQLGTAVATARDCIAKAGDLLPELDVELVLQNRGEDGVFDCQVQGRKLTITGNEEGLRCGLYTLLQSLGFHWFSPSEEIMIPSAPVKFAPESMNGHHAPDFSYRGLHICGVPHQFEERLGRWMSFNRMNRKLTHLPEVPVIGADLKKLGLRPDTTVHAYSEFIPEKKYFKTHPEYFALIGGKRTPFSKGGQLCLSNMEMRETFTRELLVKLQDNPDLGVIGICPQDGQGHCECPRCMALNTAGDNKDHTFNGRIADFVQDICARIAKAAPGRMLGHYSYSNFANFMEELPEPPENLLVSFTTFHCYKHALNDPACPVNTPAEHRLEHLLAKIRHVYVYDYYGYRWGRMPAPYLPAQEKDFRNWKKKGVDGFMTEVGPSGKAFWTGLWPAVYYASRLLWNADYPYKTAVRDMCRIRYGKAAAAMTEYFLVLQQSGQDMPGCLNKDASEFAGILTSEVRQKCGRALTRAKALEPDNALVAKEEKLFDYWCENLALRANYRTDAKIIPRKLTEKEFRPQNIHLVNWSTQLPDLQNNTEVEVAADEKQLRFRLIMHETRMDNMVCEGYTVVKSDCIELFLNDGEDPKKCYHFLIASDGRVMASECDDASWNWNWKHHAEIRCERLNDCWKLAVTVPKSDIRAGRQIGFSLIRNRHAGGSWEILGTPDGGAFFNPEKYIRIE